MGAGGRSLTALERDSPGPPPVRGGGSPLPVARGRRLCAPLVVPWAFGAAASLCLAPASAPAPVRSAGLPLPRGARSVSGLGLRPSPGKRRRTPPVGGRGALLPVLPLYQPVKGEGPPAPATLRPASLSSGPLRRPQGASPSPRGPQGTPCTPPLTRLIPWETARKEANQDVKNL